MLDRYWSGVTRRISPEAPVPVVRITELDERPGGAGNVAVNMTLVNAQLTLLGVTGDDAAAGVLEQALADFGVRSHLIRQPDVDTITKLRVLSAHQQLLRLDFESAHLAAPARFSDQFYELLTHHDLVVLSDYAKGSLCNVQQLINAARRRGKPVIIDPKGTDFDRYRGATVITPNWHEFEAVVGACKTERHVMEKAEQLRARLNLEALLITRGERGMSLVTANEPPLHLPTRAQEVADVTGAGDTVVALLAGAIAAGMPLPEAAQLANLGAGLVVAKIGAASVSLDELRQALCGPVVTGGSGVVDDSVVVDTVAVSRAGGERIVMTNGCFDILHPGHVAYLRAARALGDRLLVAVNDDASVRRLKGDTRPINTLDDRMLMLSALEAVDWVVSFPEDTPERLIAAVAPDVLVKGGDYRAQDIAGYDTVTANGGEVRVLDFLPGYSTTDLIAALHDS